MSFPWLVIMVAVGEQAIRLLEVACALPLPPAMPCICRRRHKEKKLGIQYVSLPHKQTLSSLAYKP